MVTRDIMEEIVAMGHDVTILTSRAKGLKVQEVVNGVRVHRVPVLFRSKFQVANIPSMLAYLPSSLAIAICKLDKGFFNVINTHFAVPSGPSGLLLSKIFKIPNVLSIHGGDIYDPSKSLSPHKVSGVSHIVRWVLEAATRVVAQSADTKENARRYFRVDRLIDIIPLGIKKPSFGWKNRTDFGFAENDFVLCTIGRLVRRKNVDESLQILSGLPANARIKFLVIGDGPEKTYLEELSFRLNIREQVKFIGNVSDETKFQALSISNCYISTAIHEGFGLVYLEAMECGLPIVCYNRGGQVDFLISGKTGFVVELGDRVAFAEKLMTLILNKMLREEFGSFNKELIKKYYIRRCAEKYVDLFSKAIAEYRKHDA